MAVLGNGSFAVGLMENDGRKYDEGLASMSHHGPQHISSKITLTSPDKQIWNYVAK